MNMVKGPATPWEIVVTHHELIEVLGLIIALGRKETPSSVVWLTRVPNGPRVWVISEGTVVSWVMAPAAPSDPVMTLPISDQFTALLAIAAGEDDDVTLSCNPVDGTLVGRLATRTIAADLPVDVEFTPLDLPYQQQEDSRHLNPALATVSVRDLNYLALMSHDIPRGFRITEDRREEDRLYPYVSVAIGDGKMAWTTDWRRHGLGRTTASIPARTTGSLTAMFNPYQAARIIGLKDMDEDARIFIDGPDADHIYVVGGDWGIRIRKEFEEVDRWRKSLVDAISSAGHELGGYRGRLPRNKVDFIAADSPCVASIIVDEEGKSERIRLTAVVTENVEATLQVLTLVNKVNEGLTGAKVVWRDSQILVESEFEAVVLPDICPHLSMFSAAVEQVSPTFDYVPLFIEDALVN